MINKKCHSAPRCETIIRYMFGAKLEDAHKRPNIEFIGGNITSGSPFGGINSQNIRNVDTRAIEAEFNAKMSLYTGTGTQLVSHYVLSLPHQDKLSDSEFNRVADGFLKEMGVNSSSTWVAARHNDTDCLHVHIAVCRVQMEYDSYGNEMQYGLLPDKNDFERGMEACRKLEREFNLTPTASPGENVNHKNQSSIIRAISKKVLSKLPGTVSEFIQLMAKEGVEMRPELAKNGKIRGLSYRLNSEDGRWISGSTVMSTKLTFGALTKNLNYLASRDDSTLGLGPTPMIPICAPFHRSARIKQVGLMVRVDNLSNSIRSMANANPNIYLIRFKGHFYAGLKLDIKFYPASPFLQEERRQLEWENIVRAVFWGLMNMMNKAFSQFSFEAIPWSPEYKIISGNSSTTLTFDKVTTENIEHKIEKAQQIFSSPTLTEHIERIADFVRRESGRQNGNQPNQCLST